MPVYVDDMKAHYAGMQMCHMIADTKRELFRMVDKIGVKRKWIQMAGTYREHFDICLSKRKMAVEFGAIEITQRELCRMIRARQGTGYADTADKSSRSPVVAAEVETRPETTGPSNTL